MKNFGHQRPVRDNTGTITGYKPSPARAVTFHALGHNHGPDRGRRLVVSLAAGDVIEFRPYGTQRRYAVPAIAAYEWALRSAAQSENMTKLRAIKAKRAQRLADARQRRAEKRLTREVRQA